MIHFNQLTPQQAERLALLGEELGATQHAIGKILRHGFESRNPTLHSSHAPSNRETLTKEIASILVAIDLLIEAEDISKQAISEYIEIKKIRVEPYLHHAGK